VTSLADSGEGSLRACVEAQASKLRVRVGGTIALRSELIAIYPYLTIEAARAPARIALKDRGLTIEPRM